MLAAAASVAAVPAQSGPRTLLSLNSEPGDYIGGGQQLTFTPADGDFIVTGDSERISVLLSSPTNFWFVDMTAPATRSLLPGMYEGALRGSLGVAPGLDVGGDRRGCNTPADFEQHCEDAAPALFGSLRVNAPLRKVSTSDPAASAQASGVASFTVSLWPPATEDVSVDYATVAETARAGIDYLPVAGTLTFTPGMTARIVEVPFGHVRRVHVGSRFRLELTRAYGAAVWGEPARADVLNRLAVR